MSENDKDEAWQRHVKRRMDSHVQYCATLARENGLVHSVCSIRR
jgi:hypothetical protein